MQIAENFIRRPVMTCLVMAAVLIFGIVAYRELAVSDLPNVDFPTITVSASLAGASPNTMASAVATPLEKQFTTIAGLDSMTSVSALGSTQITLQFSLNRNIDGAAQDVQAAITAAANQLPPNMPTPPTFRKVNPADSPILYLAATSPTLPLSQVDQYAETLLGQQIRSERQCEFADRDALRDAQSVHGAGQRANDERFAVSAAYRRLPQRCAGSAGRSRARLRQYS